MNLKERILKLDVDKKNRYLILSFIATLFVYVVTQKQIHFSFWQIGMILLVLIISGNWIANYPSINRSNFFVSILMPLGVMLGGISTMHFYPNLGFVFKLLVTVFFGLLYYIVLLVDNIFLVVHDRAEIIPLYRVAVTWSQIMQVVVAIPLFAGIFKISTLSYVQALLISLVSFLFTYYQLWIYQFDNDAKTTKIGEILFLSFFSLFVTYAVSISISFIAAKAFLRALFVSSVLLFLLSYISAYLKNEISRKMIIGYLFIIAVFLGTLLFFPL